MQSLSSSVSYVSSSALPLTKAKVKAKGNKFQVVSCVYTPETSRSSSMAAAAGGPKWAQKTITLPPHNRGCHLITSKIMGEIGQDLSGFKCGLANLFLQHTSASLTINENYDSDVRADTETFLNKIVPEGRSAPWRHTLEGPDDMPAHIKSSMFGCALTIPITDGKLNMGTWQAYAKEIWTKSKMENSNPVVTPMELGTKLSKFEGGEPVDANLYGSLVPSLQYLTCTRPEEKALKRIL